MKYLSKTYILLSFLSMCFFVFCYCTPLGIGSDDNDDQYKEIIKNVKRTLSYLHYAPQTIDDNFSENVYKEYFKNLDPYKTYFKPSDMAYFSANEDKMDDDFDSENIAFFHSTIDTLNHRMNDLEVLTNNLLENPFNFSLEESFATDPDKIEWAKSEQEWKDRWRKRLKYSILQEITLLEEQAKDSLKNDSISIKPVQRSFASLEAEAREKVQENMSETFRRLKQRKESDYFSVYVNAFTHEYDPHTSYFSPKDNEDFELSMSGQLEGIGATLQDEKGYPTIKSLVAGGPAWKQGDLEVEDKITKVAQGKEEAVNVVGMLLEDAIRLIRGEKGTKVTLTVKKKDESIKEITIVRDIIELEETFAKSAVIEKDGQKFGIINLPSFYLNYDGKGHDASDDILTEINSLKEEGIKGLIFDLRGNGGGDLSETVEIIGHFIEEGPTVQVLRSDGKKQVLKDKDGGKIAWDGPMVVMVNELSASASEILAAALQDYDRAIIVGSPKTYGKGTVQTMRPLNMFMNSKDEYGTLKFTVQKFYRVNGGSTQLKGVASDIVIPDRYSYINVSESAQRTALPWDQIESEEYDLWKGGSSIQQLIKKGSDRVKSKPQYESLEDYAQWVGAMDKEGSVSLNYKKFREEMDEREAKNKTFEDLKDYDNGLNILSSAKEEILMKSDSVLTDRRTNWHKSLKRDIYLEESVNVLQDWN